MFANSADMKSQSTLTHLLLSTPTRLVRAASLFWPAPACLCQSWPVLCDHLSCKGCKIWNGPWVPSCWYSSRFVHGIQFRLLTSFCQFLQARWAFAKKKISSPLWIVCLTPCIHPYGEVVCWLNQVTMSAHHILISWWDHYNGQEHRRKSCSAEGFIREQAPLASSVIAMIFNAFWKS